LIRSLSSLFFLSTTILQLSSISSKPWTFGSMHQIHTTLPTANNFQRQRHRCKRLVCSNPWCRRLVPLPRSSKHYEISHVRPLHSPLPPHVDRESCFGLFVPCSQPAHTTASGLREADVAALPTDQNEAVLYVCACCKRALFSPINVVITGAETETDLEVFPVICGVSIPCSHTTGSRSGISCTACLWSLWLTCCLCRGKRGSCAVPAANCSWAVGIGRARYQVQEPSISQGFGSPNCRWLRWMMAL